LGFCKFDFEAKRSLRTDDTGRTDGADFFENIHVIAATRSGAIRGSARKKV
jgi:hypothetical protein